MSNEYIINHYNNYDEDGRLLSRQGQPEFLTTVKYVEKHLFEGAKIIEIGAATGRYSHYFAKKRYEVDAVELVPSNIEKFKEKITPDEKITITEGNACDLSFIESEKYDITLILGPLYHLYTEEDEKKALSEAIRITKKGGIVFAAYCMNDFVVVQFCFLKNHINDERYKPLIDPVTFKLTSTPEELFVMHTKSEIDKLMSGFNTERIAFVGTDMVSCYPDMQRTLEVMDDQTFETYMKYHFSICEREDLVGFSCHTLDIFRKL
ncbi:MAG: class I SAM-dependent methyltransferase [Ruminococcaceae bacterium]|nr:class I SAM-dependent methyltransferase [Oscillospiraceae bacterium]